MSDDGESREAGSESTNAGTTLDRRSVLKIGALFAGSTAVATGAGGYLSQEPDPDPSTTRYGYGGTPTTTAPSPTTTTDAAATASGATRTASSRSTTDGETRTGTPARSRTDTTDSAADGTDSGNGGSRGPSGDATDGGGTDTAGTAVSTATTPGTTTAASGTTATPGTTTETTDSSSGIVEDDYGVQGYGEYGYGGVPPGPTGTESDCEEVIVSVPDRTVTLGETTTVVLTVSGLTEGLAGISLSLTMDDGSVAAFTDVTVEPGFGVVDTTLTEGSVEVSALDRDGAVDPTNDCDEATVTLLSITARGESTDLTDFTLTIDSMSDDEGRSLSPETDVGRITVVE